MTDGTDRQTCDLDDIFDWVAQNSDLSKAHLASWQVIVFPKGKVKLSMEWISRLHGVHPSLALKRCVDDEVLTFLFSDEREAFFVLGTEADRTFHRSPELFFDLMAAAGSGAAVRKSLH